MRNLIAILLLVPTSLFSQYKVTIILDSIPAQTNSESIFISGNFNNWQPDDPNTILSKNPMGKFTKEFNEVSGGEYEFKFTLGSQETVECKADGSDIPNRKLLLTSDTVIHLSVAAWKTAKKNSALIIPGNDIPVINALPYIAVAEKLLRRNIFMQHGSIHYHDIKV